MDTDDRSGSIRLSETSKILIEEIIKTFTVVNNLKFIARLNALKDFSILGKLDIDLTDELLFEELSTQSYKKYDLVIGDFPFGVKSEVGRHNLNTQKTIESLDLIGDDGFGLYIFEGFYHAFSRQNLFHHLNYKGFYIQAVINLPKNFFPHTSIRPILVLVSKQRCIKTFFAEADNVDLVLQLIENLKNKDDTNKLDLGLFEELEKFEGFVSWHIEKQIRSLNTDYSKYKKFKLNNLAKNIRVIRPEESFVDDPNIVYIKNIGNHEISNKIDSLIAKPHNYFAVEVDNSKLNPTYLCNYLSSTLGKLVLSKAKDKSTFIPKMPLSECRNLDIALPDLRTQEQIANTIDKLETIKLIIASFEGNLSLNPINSQSTLDQINKVTEIVSELNDADKIKSLIRTGESDSIEFKQTLTLCIRENQKKPDLAMSSLKTIAAFLNSRGGFLLIGVADNGEVTGIDAEIEMFHKNADKFMLSFKDLIKYKIGEQFYPFIKQRLVAVDDKHVVLVECLPSNKAVFVDEKDFYVRTNPATDRLEGQKQATYIETRFYGARWQS